MAVYHVGKGLDFESFTKCLIYVRDNGEGANEIFIHEGEYDIFREYREAEVPRTPVDLADINDYMPYNVIVPDNTHIVGLGKVVLNYMPSADETYETESHVVSPLNVSGSATIENIEIHCKNGRYCIHDETLGMPQYAGARKTYIKVRTFKHANDENLGHMSGIGFGFDNRMIFRFVDCEFFNETNVPFYMHNRSKNRDGYVFPVSESGSVTLDNCLIDARSPENMAVFMGNCAPQLHHKVVMNNCRIRGYVAACDERDRISGTRNNSYEFILNECSFVRFVIADKENAYPPSVGNPKPAWQADDDEELDQIISE